ncbi:zinc finger BED domain-containing protein 1-like [Tachysurus ichikawai]
MISRLLEQRWPVTATLSDPNGVQKSIQSTVFETAAVKAYQSVAAQEMTSRWERETKLKDDGENICLIAAALDPRFRKLKFLPAEDSLKVHLKAMLAKSYLSVPATSTASERLFSVAGNIVTKKRASLTSEHVDMLTFLHCNAI